MNITLKKITRSFMNRANFFVDFTFEDIQMVVKGCQYNSKTGNIIFPILKTHGGSIYSPITFPESSLFKAVLAKMQELVKATPLPEYEEGVEEKIKAIKLLKAHKEKERIDAKERMRNQPRKPKFGKKAFKPAPRFEHPKSNGVLSYTPAKRNDSNAGPAPMGRGFTEIPVRRREY